MNLSPCFSIPENRLVNPQTEYERSCDTSFINASTPIVKKKSSSFSPYPNHPKKKSSDIVLDGKPSFDLEEAVENDEVV
ncbi:MAG: hypothetical protein ACOYK6_02250 [Chthoniobacterales bacterium]